MFPLKIITFLWKIYQGKTPYQSLPPQHRQEMFNAMSFAGTMLKALIISLCIVALLILYGHYASEAENCNGRTLPQLFLF